MRYRFYTESQLFDLDNGNGPQPYKAVIDCGTVGLSTVYEYTKYITDRNYRGDIDADVANYITGAVYQSVSVHPLTSQQDDLLIIC